MFDRHLIPPGINDERTRAIMDAFSHAASLFDFSKLLMRNSSEIPDNMLELAIHDFSLNEFVPPDGLPVEAARRLIDAAWPLHEKQGTDEGVHLGQSLLGTTVTIEHWWQMEPEGAHDTQKVTVWFDGALLEGGTPVDSQHQSMARQMVHATKRWSQDTALGFGINATITNYVGAFSSFGGLFTAAMPNDNPTPKSAIEYVAVVSAFGGTFTAGMEI